MGHLPNLKALTGICGYAVLLVLLSHSSNSGLYLVPALNFSGIGRNGVFLFFVLSAFLLTRQFLVADFKHCQKSAFILHYFKRRFLRIYPLFLLGLLVYFGFYQLGTAILPLTPTDIVKSLLLQDAKGMFWTIPVEFQFYFLLPGLAAAFINAPKTTLVFSSLFCALWNVYYPPPPGIVPNVLPFLGVFVAGSLTAFIVHHFNDSGLLVKKRGLTVLTGGLLVAQLALCPSFYTYVTGKPATPAYFHDEFMLFALLSALLIASALYSDGWSRRLLESRFLVFWGGGEF